jgi:hypothetical protein
LRVSSLGREWSLPIGNERGNKIIKKHIVVFALLTLILCSTNSFAKILEQPPGDETSKLADPHAVVEVFLKAVSRGELVVFDRRIEESMLIPVRVEYVYELDSAVPTIKVYSKLKDPMSVPGHDNCKVKGISVTLDANGGIIKIESHVGFE